MEDIFNVQELLDKITEKLTENDPKLTNESASEKAKSLLKGLIDGGAEMISEFANAVGSGEYELPDGSLLQVGAPGVKKVEISPETQEKVDKVLAKVDEMIPPVETVRLRLSRDKTTVFDSKMGGVPYFPKGMEYPTVREGEHAGKPLYFLAQLNFGKLPKIEGFPTEGILQFFAGGDGSGDYGMSWKDKCDQNAFRVLFHEYISTDENGLFSVEDMPDFEYDKDAPDFAFTGEFLLTAEETEKMPVTEYDFRFVNYVYKAYNELFNAELKSFYDMYDADRPLSEAIYQARATVGTRMGGYPHFEQEDLRGYEDNGLSGHTVLLFQSDSENGGEGWENMVCWGDAGVANFFITPEDLARRDFSNVLYNWDCG